MTTFGAAIGLSATSPFAGKGLSATALGIATALWVLWIAVSSFMAGAYIAGRLSRRIPDASEHEADVRDGAHGLVVWALGTLLLAYVASSSIAGVAKLGADAVSGAASVAGSTAKTLTQSADPVNYTIDRLTRGVQGADMDRMRQDVMRIFANAATTGTLSNDDKAYVTSRIASAANISQEDATKRIDETQAQVNALTERAKQAAESARKVGILIAFLTASSIVISAAAAWYAAAMGGKHRDEGVDHSHMTSWR